MEKIFCIGEALIDMICTDKGESLSNGEHFLKKPGGAPTNVAAAIAALGGQVQLAAKVGNDPFGQQLISVMKDFGVDTNWMLQDNTAFTTMAFVSLLKNGERDFVFSRGADGALSTEDLIALDMSQYSIVHFGSATGFLEGPLQKTYTSVLENGINSGNIISFDPNYRHLLFAGNTQRFIEQSWHFLARCHFFKVSDEEAMLLTNTSTLEAATSALKEKTTAIFAITLGEAGTLLRLNDTLTKIPSISIIPEDTTGAGDAFVGAVLYQLRKQTIESLKALTAAEWQTIITNANKAGAKTCMYLGAMEAFKHLNSTIFE